MDLLYAVLLTLPLSVVFVILEIGMAARSSLAQTIRPAAGLYLLLVMVGNAVTTLLAAASIDAQDLPHIAPPFLWWALLGVFAGKAILQNVNLSFAKYDVLTIHEWIVAARGLAVADAVERETRQKENDAQKLATRLRRLPTADLNAQAINLLGAAQVLELDALAARHGADSALIKSLAMAKSDYKKAEAIAPA